MSISTYKRWMKESYLFEKDPGETEITWTDPKTKEKKKATAAGIIKKGEDHPAYDDAKAAMDGKEKPDTKKGMGISKTGGLGGEPEDKPFGGDTGKDADFEKPSGDDEKTDINDSEFKEKMADDLEKAKEIMAKKEPEGSDAWYPGVNDLVKKLKSGRELFVGDEDEAGELDRSNITDTDTMKAMGVLIAMDPEKYKPIFDPDGEHEDEWEETAEKYGGKQGRTGTEEIKVINGKKYRAIRESVNKRVAVKEVHKWLKGLEEYRYRKVPGVDARRITSFVNNGLNETDLPISLQKKWESAKYNKEKSLADRFIKQRISQKLTQTESKHPLKEQYNRLFTDRIIL